MNDTEYLKAMGAKIKAARQASGIYQRDLGKMYNIHHGALSEIEKGIAIYSHLKNLADKLNVDVKDFM